MMNNSNIQLSSNIDMMVDRYRVTDKDPKIINTIKSKVYDYSAPFIDKRFLASIMMKNMGLKPNKAKDIKYEKSKETIFVVSNRNFYKYAHLYYNFTNKQFNPTLVGEYILDQIVNTQKQNIQVSTLFISFDFYDYPRVAHIMSILVRVNHKKKRIRVILFDSDFKYNFEIILARVISKYVVDRTYDIKIISYDSENLQSTPQTSIICQSLTLNFLVESYKFRNNLLEELLDSENPNVTNYLLELDGGRGIFFSGIGAIFHAYIIMYSALDYIQRNIPDFKQQLLVFPSGKIYTPQEFNNLIQLERLSGKKRKREESILRKDTDKKVTKWQRTSFGITIKDKKTKRKYTYKIHTGKKGGKYIIKNNKKVYIK